MEDFYCGEVLSGRTPVEVVHETGNVLAFEHTRPHYKDAHVVVIPKRHIASFIDFDDGDADIVREVLEVARTVARMVAEEWGGAHVVTNVGKYQESKHLHIHVGAG
ncbi:MAG: HIT domain-containing protein [Dehalococcoidia bacterium]